MTSSSATPEDRFRQLYRDHYRRVLAYALRRTTSRSDAEDVVAETFLVAWRRFEELPDDDTVVAFLFGTARRVLANLHRGGRRRKRLTTKIELVSPGTAAPGADSSVGELEDLERALAALSPDDREILLLAAWEELPHAQIAEMLGIKPATVAVRLHRARRRLSDRYVKALGASGHEHPDDDGADS